MTDRPQPNPDRNAYWPKPSRTYGQVTLIREFLERGIAPHSVHIPWQKIHVEDRAEWLTQRHGPPMIYSGDYRTPPYWTHGIWLGVAMSARPEDGRIYYFLDPDHAFEFKVYFG